MQFARVYAGVVQTSVFNEGSFGHSLNTTKKHKLTLVLYCCAVGGTRTLTRLLPADFKSAAYTGSATTACLHNVKRVAHKVSIISVVRYAFHAMCACGDEES